MKFFFVLPYTMTLRTDIFKFSNETLPEWNPSDDGYEWIPTDFTTFVALAHPADVQKVIANDVYRHLVFWEDIDAINDGRFMSELDTWLAREFKKAPPLWKAMMTAAMKEEQNWKDDGYSIYVRPSLWFLREDWMIDKLHICFVVDKIPSLTFRDEDGHPEDQLIYSKPATPKNVP